MNEQQVQYAALAFWYGITKQVRAQFWLVFIACASVSHAWGGGPYIVRVVGISPICKKSCDLLGVAAFCSFMKSLERASSFSVAF